MARHYASLSRSPRADIVAAVAEGLAEVFSGQTDVGITRLTETLDRAKALKVASREVLVALVKALEYAGKPDGEGCILGTWTVATNLGTTTGSFLMKPNFARQTFNDTIREIAPIANQ